jgi:hypothetical protein
MKLKNGVKVDKKTLAKYEVIDNNIVRHPGVTRLQSDKKTPFQTLLTEVIEKKFVLSDDELSDILKRVLTTPQSTPEDKHLFSEDNQDIIDCWNDGSRRYFDSMLAKNIMNHFLSSKHSTLSPFIKNVTDFLKSEYRAHDKARLKVWSNIRKGYEYKRIKESNLADFALLRKNMIELIKDEHFTDSSFILELLDLHYLTHAAGRLPSYKVLHPTGTLKSYTENSIFYKTKNRGRVTGFGFNHNNPSYHLGTMRSIDKTPHDMRRPRLISSETRCPDRLYMVHPKVARRHPENWLNQAFSNPYNSTYVNGLSGSTLLAINAILFYICSQEGDASVQEAIREDNFKLLKNYWLMVVCLFIYFEGGHTLTEVMDVFNLSRIQSNLETVLKTPQDTFSLQTILLDDPEIYKLVAQSLIETAKYQAVIDSKTSANSKVPDAAKNIRLDVNKLFKNKQSVIDEFFNEFKEDIEQLDNNNPNKAIALTLYGTLCEHKEKYYEKPNRETTETFIKQTHDTIKATMPTFHDNTTWSDKVKNVASNVINFLIKLLNNLIGTSIEFFKPIQSPCQTSTTEFERSISSSLSKL